MGGPADGVVVHGQIVADRPHHVLTGVQTRAHLHLSAEVASGFFGNLAEGVLHGEGRITGPDRVILMRYRRTEQCHDAVAQYFVDGAFVAVHGTHHRLDGRIEDTSRVFRVVALDKLHGTLDVGK